MSWKESSVHDWPSQIAIIEIFRHKNAKTQIDWRWAIKKCKLNTKIDIVRYRKRFIEKKDTNSDNLYCNAYECIVISLRLLNSKCWNYFCEAWRWGEIPKSWIRLSSPESRQQTCCLFARWTLAFQPYASLWLSFCGINHGSWPSISSKNLNFASITAY